MPEADEQSPGASPQGLSAEDVADLLGTAPVAYFRWLIREGFPVAFAGGNLSQLGYTPEDFTSGRVSWVAITHPDDHARLEKEVSHCLEDGMDSFSNRYRLRAANGDYIWIQDWNRVIHDAGGIPFAIDGVIVRVSGVFEAAEKQFVEEVGRRAAAEEESEDARLYLQTVVETSHDGILVIDAEGRFEFANDSGLRDFGYQREEFIGVHFINMVPSDMHPFIMDRWKEVQLGHGQPYEVDIITKAGERKCLMVSHRHMDITGVRKYCVVVKDVTERKRAETELARHREQLEALVAERTVALRESNAGLVSALESRNEAVKALRESERNFRAIAENAQEAIIICDEHDAILYANSFACEMTGYSESELLEMTGLSVIIPEDFERVRQFSRDRMAGAPVPRPYEATLVARDGQLITVEVTGAVTQWRGCPATIGMLRDVTDRKHVERELEFIRMMLERAQEVAHTGSWTLDLSSNKVTWSRELYRIVGVDPEAYQPGHEERPRIIHPQDLDLVESELARVVRDRSSSRMESRLVRPDGEVRDILSQFEYVNGGDRASDLVVGTATDITEKRRLEKDLLDAAQQEQQRLGLDLHDTLGQELAGIAFLAKALQRQVADLAPSAADEASRLAELARLSVEQCRRIAHGLAPLTIEAERLGMELAKLCEGATELYGMPCDCRVTFDGEINDSRIASHVYQIAREAVMNAMRHAGASRVILQLVVADGFGELVVSDDGNWGAVGGSPRGIGLRVMRHRSELIGGVFDIQHADGSPTTVTCRFPCQPSV